MTESDAIAQAIKTRPLASGRFCRVHGRMAMRAEAQVPRVGIVASKKLLRTSVRRNVAKRQIRESFRLHRGQLPSADYLVRVTAVDLALPARVWGVAFRAELDALWSRAAQRTAHRDSLTNATTSAA